MADLKIAPPLLKTKLHIPHRRPDMVPRSLLIKQLNERIQRKLTLITAPAGYGKTNLASEWIYSLQSEDTSNNRITWLSLEEADSEPIRFLSYVIAALQQVAPEIGVGALSLFEMTQSPPINTVLNELINDITCKLRENCSGKKKDLTSGGLAKLACRSFNCIIKATCSALLQPWW